MEIWKKMWVGAFSEHSEEQTFPMLRRLKHGCVFAMFELDQRLYWSNSGLTLLVSLTDVSLKPEAATECFLQQNSRMA